jgi:exodeoxyribonuclease VII large subunit
MPSADQLGLNFAPPPRRVWNIGDLISAVRTQMEREYSDIFVEGEISNFRPASSGHLYFTLKDNGSQIRVVMFRMQARLLRFRPEGGMQVMVRGRVTVYEPRGELQLSAEYMEPKGAGALQVAFEQLKAKLGAEGLFAQERKKPLPPLPRRIGVVTSPGGAVIQDILNILRRRHESANVLIFPAQVQGESAAAEVSSGLRYFNRTKNVDVIIVARGGGSLEDLAAFNDEGLARTIAASEITVISAVGHETDFTIADFVADLRAPTPSAAAELVIRSKEELDNQMTALQQRLARAVRYQLLMARQSLTEVAQHGAFARMRDVINKRQQRLDDAVFHLAHAQRELLKLSRQRLDAATARIRFYDLRRQFASTDRILQGQTSALVSAMKRIVFQRDARLERLTAQLNALSPLNILERGYALVFDASGNLVKDAAQVQPGDDLSARLARGSITVTVKESGEATK